MITAIRMEILPRYGSNIGNVWISQVDEEGKGNEDVVGSLQLRNPEEVELWQTTINEMDRKIKEELLKLQERRS